jgi:hypothetical protein
MNIDRFYRKIGVIEPQHIDIKAVAFELGLEVRFAPLLACEARIIGTGNRGIITVREGAYRLRQRFSIAHEIGHWTYHRGKALTCSKSDIGDGATTSRNREKIADEFASRLLLPDFLINPIAKNIRNLRFSDIIRISTDFRVSKTATARRLIELNAYPSILIGYGPNGRRWFARSAMIPERWFPAPDLDPESDAFNCVFTGNALGRPSKIGADAFFDRSEAERYELFEETIPVGDRQAITILTLTDDEMLEDR